MKTLIGVLADTRLENWDTVVAVGSGIGSWLPFLRRLQGRHLVLVEPQPELAALLDREVDEERNEQVLATALVDIDVPTATLYACSNPRFTSVSPPTRLNELLPNLHWAEGIVVDAIALDGLASRLALDSRQRNLLVLEAPGMLSALRSTTGLSRFSDIVVHAGSEPLYESDIDRDQLHGFLAQAGFEAWAAGPDDTYPFERRAFRRNHALLELRELRRASEVERADAQARVKASEDRIDDLARDCKSLAEQLDAARSRERQVTGSIAALQANLRQADSSIRAGEERAALLISKLEERESELATLKERETRSSETLAALQAELQHAKAAGRKQEEQVEALTRTLDERDSQLAKLEDQAKQSSDAMTALRAQLEQANAKLQAQQERSGTLSASLAERDSELSRLREEAKQASDAKAMLQAELDQAKAKLRVQEERAATLAGQLGERDSKIVALEERARHSAKEAQEAMEHARQQLADAQAEVASTRESHRQLKEEHDRIEREVKAAIAERDTEVRKNQQGSEQLERLKLRLNELDGQLVNARDAMTLAIRMQTLRENDLEDIRDRYARLQGTFQSQRELLKKLSERLVAANEYFQQLAGGGVSQGGLAALEASDMPAATPAKPRAGSGSRKGTKERGVKGRKGRE